MAKQRVAHAADGGVDFGGPPKETRQRAKNREDLAALVDPIDQKALLVPIAQTPLDAQEPSHG
jgi:hypothetical protein